MARMLMTRFVPELRWFNYTLLLFSRWLFSRLKDGLKGRIYVLLDIEIHKPLALHWSLAFCMAVLKLVQYTVKEKLGHLQPKFLTLKS